MRWNSGCWGRASEVLTAVLLFAALIVLGLVALIRIRRRRVVPLRDEAGAIIPGSISERVFVETGGIRQGMFIQSANPQNHDLLFLHGGPGMPEYFMVDGYPTGLERDFTMVWGEQRGVGMSFSSDILPDNMTVTQMIADTVEVADYLRARFGKEKIILLRHWWGSCLGIQVTAKAPGHFHFYDYYSRSLDTKI